MKRLNSIPDNWNEMKDEEKIVHLDKMIAEHDKELEKLDEPEPENRMESLKAQEVEIDNELIKLEEDEHGN